MKITSATLVIALAFVASGGYGLYRLGMNQGMQMSAAPPGGGTAAGPQKAGDVDPTTGKKVLYWHDPMVPGTKFDKPGKSPFMDMQLAPVYADGGGDDSAVSVSSRVAFGLPSTL